MTSKRFYRIQEVSDLLSVPATTLRWWEDAFPMFRPNRLPSGQRRFTQADIKVAEKIKELLYVKGMKTDGAVELMKKTYRKSRPRGLRKCQTPQDAIVLLEEAIAAVDDSHAIAKVEAVVAWLNKLDTPIIHKNIQDKKYFISTSDAEKQDS